MVYSSPTPPPTQKKKNKHTCMQILSTVLERGEAREALSLVVTAAQCMREVAVDKKVVELRHPGQGEDKLTKIVSSRNRASYMLSRDSASAC